MPQVSIIVPIYGVEKYIERCARSLFEQTFDDLEYIFVDDCTKDASVEVLQTIMEDYPNRKSQIKILRHEENKGLPQARKTGILAALGDYIINIDSDDWVEKDMIEVLFNNVRLNEADIVICDYYVSDGEQHLVKKGSDIHLKNNELLEQMCRMFFPWAVWNKMIKRSLFDGVVFPTCSYAEDMALIFQIMGKTEKISYVSQCLYYYYINPQSITRVLTEKQILNNIDGRICNNNIVFNVFESSASLRKHAKIIELLKWQTKTLLWPLILENKTYYEEWAGLYSEINVSLFFNPFISLKDKIKHILTLLRFYPR